MTGWNGQASKYRKQVIKQTVWVKQTKEADVVTGSCIQILGGEDISHSIYFLMFHFTYQISILNLYYFLYLEKKN
jgi:hypothetical protein